MKRKKTKPKSFYKKLGKKYYIPAVILLLAGIFYFTPARGIVAQKLVDKGNSYFNSGGVYDLEKAAKWYKAAEFIDHKYSTAHYQLARVYFVQNKLQEAKSEIDKAIAVNNNSNRAYYIKGLINGYSKNYPEAIADFSKFVEKTPEEWAGYNDLAWVYFENKDYENAKTTLEKGLEVKPDNPWLLNGLGAAYHALGENDKAKEILDKASQSAGKLTASEWKMAYPGNDPSSADWDLAEFKTNVKYNLSLAYDKDSHGGIIVPACNSSCYSSYCSGCNIYQCCYDTDHWTSDCHDSGYSESCCPPAPAPAPDPYCGDGSCNGGENCSWCSQDCGGCAPSSPSSPSSPYCGDGSCNNGENCSSCSGDCGGCASPSPSSPYCGDESCGSANGSKICNNIWPAASALCSDPTQVSNQVTGAKYGDWTWSCNGTCGGSSNGCSAKGSGYCGWIETNP